MGEEVSEKQVKAVIPKISTGEQGGELAGRLREFHATFDEDGGWHDILNEAADALDSLLRRVEQAERERDEARAAHEITAADYHALLKSHGNLIDKAGGLRISTSTAALAIEVHARRASPNVGPLGSDDDVRFLALSMAGEAGEAANVVKKAWRDGKPLNAVAVAEEVAGTACYLIGLASAINLDLDAEMRKQMAAFEARYPEKKP